MFRDRASATIGLEMTDSWST